MFRTAARTGLKCCRCYSTSPATLPATPHPALSLIPSFLSRTEQAILLRHSLRLLDSPSRTTSLGRKKRREWMKANTSWAPEQGFMADEAYAWEEAHFDGVISQYREMLVREGAWGEAGERGGELAEVLDKVYSLLPPRHTPPSASPPLPSPASSSTLSPPPHLIMHLLHLSSRGSIRPHVDNLEAFGRQIVGISLGGERVLRFKQVSEPPEEERDGPEEFEVLVPPGSAFLHGEPLRTHYTHEVLETADWEGREVGGTQRLSVMLRDRLPSSTTPL
ncbi:hypothetical protein JCM11251_000818 [Rhodosporidiobolus azoricus]